MSARIARGCRKCWQDQGCVSGELMGDLEKAEAGKGCRGRALDKTHSLEIVSEGATVILTPHGIHDMD